MSTRDWAAIKRNAQNVYPSIQRMERLQKYVDEYNELKDRIASDEGSTVRISGGYTTSELVQRVVADYVDPVTGEIKVGKDGHPLKTTKWVPNTEIVSYDAERNVYMIEPKPVETAECPVSC